MNGSPVRKVQERRTPLTVVGRDGGAARRPASGRPVLHALPDEPTLVFPTREVRAPAGVDASRRARRMAAGALGGGVVLGAAGTLLSLALCAVLAGAVGWWATSGTPTEVAAAPPKVVGVPVILVATVPSPSAAARAPVPSTSASVPRAPVAEESVAAEPAERVIVALPPQATATASIASAPVVWWHSAPATATPAPAPVAARRLPAPTPVAATTGVAFTTDPAGAHVVVDGTWRGRTPLTVDLRPGRHRVTLEDGRASSTFLVDTASAARLCYAVEGEDFVASACP